MTRLYNQLDLRVPCLSLCFKTAITGRPAYLCGIYMGSCNTNLNLYVCWASVCTAELSFQPGGILCSNQTVTPATKNLISKDSCILLLTLQDLLYSLEADIKCFLSCLASLLEAPHSTLSLTAFWKPRSVNLRLLCSSCFQGENIHQETIIHWATEMAE